MALWRCYVATKFQNVTTLNNATPSLSDRFLNAHNFYVRMNMTPHLICPIRLTERQKSKSTKVGQEANENQNQGPAFGIDMNL